MALKVQFTNRKDLIISDTDIDQELCNDLDSSFHPKTYSQSLRFLIVIGRNLCESVNRPWFTEGELIDYFMEQEITLFEFNLMKKYLCGKYRFKCYES